MEPEGAYRVLCGLPVIPFLSQFQTPLRLDFPSDFFHLGSRIHF